MFNLVTIPNGFGVMCGALRVPVGEIIPGCDGRFVFHTLPVEFSWSAEALLWIANRLMEVNK